MDSLAKTFSLVVFLTLFPVMAPCSDQNDAEGGKALPNILLITLDTTRADHLGCYGAAFASTPNLDSLARTGTRFDHAYSPAPLTLPSHASMLTGLVPRRHGVRDNALFRLDRTIPTLTEKLKEAGYRTAAFVSAAILDRVTAIDRGFDHFDDNVRVGERSFFNYEERAASQVTAAVISYLDSLSSSPPSPSLLSSPSLSPPASSAAAGKSERSSSLRSSDSSSAQGETDEPIFLWVHYFDPHLPYVPPEPFKTRFKESPYDGEIAFMDQEIGRLLEAVRKKSGGEIGREASTKSESETGAEKEGGRGSGEGKGKEKGDRLLIVVAGDHGESLGEHGEAAHDVFIYNATQRVPLIITGSGIPAGKVVERNVGLIDIAPTILELLAPAVTPIENSDGRSFAPLFNSKEKTAKQITGTTVKDEAIPDYEMESFFPNFSYGWAPLRGIVRGEMKYIEAPRPELYNLRTDASEKKNMVSSQGKEAEKLAETLKRLVADDFPGASIPDAELLELRQRIESLGYVSGGRAGKEDKNKGVTNDSGRTAEDKRKSADAAAHGPLIDPKEGMKWIGDLEAARRELQTGNPEKGIPLLERLLAKNPENFPAIMTLAQCHLASGNFEEAIRLCRDAVSANPENDIAHFNLANALKEKWRGNIAGRKEAGAEARDEAQSGFERVIEINPRHAEAYLSYFSLLVLDRKQDEAYQLLKRACQAGVSDPEIETNLAYMEMARGDADQARQSFARAVLLNPHEARALEGLGRVAYAEGKFQEAADYYARALASSPSVPLAKTLGSILLFDLHDRAGARRAYLKAAELSPPDDPDRKELQEILDSLKEAP